jgi:phosphatidylinositol glycan class W
MEAAREKLAELMSHSFFFKHDTSELRKTLSKTVGVGMLSLLVWYISEHFQKTSRRLYNLPFVALLVFISMYMLALIICVELISSGSNIHVRTLDLINRHQLAVFLVANLLTGAINLAIPTIDVSTFAALSILIVYLFIVAASPWVIERCWPSVPIAKPPRQKP